MADIKLMGEPTLLKLKTMRGADGNPLRIIPRIAAGDYMTFGICLLQDKNGVNVGLLKKTHAHDGPVGITDAIIQKWLTSGAAPTRTYQHLIECLRLSELDTLAEDIDTHTLVATGTPTATHGTTQMTTASFVSHNTTPQLPQDMLISSATMLPSTTTTVPATIEANSIPQHAPYASYLKEVYTHLSQSHSSQHWTHLPRCEFVQLAMIRGKELRRGGPVEKMIRLALQGKIETIMSDKIPTDLESLFLPQPLLPLVVLPPPKFHRVMLLEGAPGGGKSTLALHICHKWAQGASFLARFDIVVLAYLRDEAIQNASTLADILPADIMNPSQVVATQMQARYGQNVLFIFDGWDEFPSHLQKQSLVSKIIREPHKLSLHQSTVIITTRPVASGNLLHIAYERVEILGFTQHQIREYIEKSLDGDSTRIQKLVQHLKHHPVIKGYCYIPLHVALLVHIFLTMKGVLPTTLHELFCNLVLCCIVRELETHKSDQNVEAELSSLDDLPDYLKSQLSDLGVLAYEGVMQDKVIFYEKDLKAMSLPTNLPSLGLLQAVEGLTLTSKSCSYNFLHLSVQELLAAYHISQMNSGTQVEVFKKLFVSTSPRFEAVLHYYCGFTKLKNPAIQDFISTYSHQQTSFQKILPLLHCLFEAKQPRLAQLINHRFTNVIEFEFLSHNPVDYIVVGYFIFSLLSSFISDEPNSILLRIGDYVNDYRLKLLVLLSQISWCSIERWLRVDMQKSCISGKDIKVLASHLKQPLSAISELSIDFVDIQSDGGLLQIAEALQTNCYLTKLKLTHVNLYYTKENDLALTKILCLNKTLTHFDLSYNTLSDLGAHCIFRGLQQNTTLTHLNLQSNGITGCEGTAQALNKVLQGNKSLTYLNLSLNKIFSYSYAGSCCILEGLQHNTTLVHLNLDYTGLSATEDTTRALTTMLQVNTSLTHLILSRNCSFFSVFKSLQHNTTLVHLDLSQSGIKEVSMDIESTCQALNEMLIMNKTLAYLNLSDIGISDSATCSIFQALQHNISLVHLDLHGAICISDKVAVCIAEALVSNCSLQILDIHSNWPWIGNIRFNCIAKSLESNTTLRELYLEYNHGETTVNEKVHAINSIRQMQGLHPVCIMASPKSGQEE